MARVLIAVLAVLAVVWLGIRERDERLLAIGGKEATSATSEARARDAFHALDEAKLLNPDTRPDLYRAILLQSRHDLRGSIRIVEAVVRREPDNVAAWSFAYRLALAAHDKALAAIALAQFRRLNPHYGAPA